MVKEWIGVYDRNLVGISLAKGKRENEREREEKKFRVEREGRENLDDLLGVVGYSIDLSIA